MSTRLDPNLMNELKDFGAVGIEKCYNCGNCTASCPLASDEHPFPRNLIRYAQVGMKDRLLGSTDAWQCYYCGDCSATCPKNAEPAETMMAMRRWLISQYDQSGTGAKLYQSEKSVRLTILRAGLLVLAYFILLHLTGVATIVTDRVALNSFAPVLWIWVFVLLHFLYLGWRLLRNSRKMATHILQKSAQQVRIPISIYLSELKVLVTNFATQRRWRDCDSQESRAYWLKHLLFASGYVTMLILIVPLLWWFQTENVYPLYHPQRWLGYFATVMLGVFSVDFIISRAKRQKQFHRFSHPTDWMFPIFVLMGAVTGILVHIFRYLGSTNPAWAWPTYIIYFLHVVAMIAMLDTEVGIGKWTHLVYRPLALYLEAVLKKEVEQKSLKEAIAPAD